jgi:PAS domain S-box-containing protein
MGSFYQVLAIMTAGISLVIGLFSLLTFIKKPGEIVNQVFSVLCLLGIVFIILAPIGFKLHGSVVNANLIEVKKIATLSFSAIFTWLVVFYTEYKKRKTALILNACIFVASLLLLTGTSTTGKLLWTAVISGILAINFSYTFYLASYLWLNNQRAKANILFAVITCSGLAFVFSIIDNLNKYSFAGEGYMFSLLAGLCFLAFIVIFGIQPQTSLNKLEVPGTKIGVKAANWDALMDNIHLVIVKTDIKERITYINPFGKDLLGYKNDSDIIDSNWQSPWLSLQQAMDNGNNFKKEILSDEGIIKERTVIRTKLGKERIIEWTSGFIIEDEGGIKDTIRIGSDITEHEAAINQIKELNRQLEKVNLKPHDNDIPSGIQGEVIGKSKPFLYAIQKSKQVAATNASVLLLGETGVGKDAFADLIHATSLRSTMPFIKVNCGALPAELIEDDLFGHEKGAFTGAIQSRMGRFEKANGGTIFLDEIGELPVVLQPKLLRVLQSGEFERVGGHQTIKVDVRVIAATNSDLEKEIRENRFREDLFYRLNVFPITIPPLRKRSEDIMLLIQHFIERKSKEHGKHFENISKADMNRLCDYEWPGNIRELKNVIERGVISSEDNTLKFDWFYDDLEKSTKPTSTASLEEMETAYIVKVLQECRWKINGENGAAEKLVMHPNTLRSRMKKLNISMPWKHD